MPTESAIGIIVVVILFIVVVTIQLSLTANEEEERNRKPTPVSHLRGILALSDHMMWQVTITRRSGYVHSDWHVAGSRNIALDVALDKMRSARIDTVAVICNRSDKFEARAFYDSTGARRTGKYIGGFMITPRT
jgi:hypothetical protein